MAAREFTVYAAHGPSVPSRELRNSDLRLTLGHLKAVGNDAFEVLSEAHEWAPYLSDRYEAGDAILYVVLVDDEPVFYSFHRHERRGNDRVIRWTRQDTRQTSQFRENWIEDPLLQLRQLASRAQTSVEFETGQPLAEEVA